MDVKNHDFRTELRVILTLLRDKEQQPKYLAGLSLDHFGNKVTRGIWKRLQAYLDSGKSLPAPEVLASDVTLSEAAKNLLLSSDTITSLSAEDWDTTFETLEHFRKLRKLIAHYQGLVSLLEDDEEVIDWEKVLRDFEKTSMSLTREASEDEISSLDDIEEILENLKVVSHNLVPTGFPHVDKELGGFGKGDLVVLVAPSSSGKSSIAVQFAINFYREGYKVGFVSMEMSRETVWQRVIANISSTKIGEIKTSPERVFQRAEVLKAIEDFVSLSEKGGRLDVITPQGSVTPRYVDTLIRANHYDVVILDYIRLMEADGRYDSEAHRLGIISRRLKVIGANTGTIILTLAQANDDGRVKYSRAIREDSDVMLTWEMTEEIKQDRQVDVKVDKARNAPAGMSITFGFDLAMSAWYSLGTSLMVKDKTDQAISRVEDLVNDLDDDDF